jgi:peptidoglycan-associated lipoprotein
MKQSSKVCLLVLAVLALVAAPGCKTVAPVLEPQPAEPVVVAEPAPTNPPPAHEVKQADDFVEKTESLERPSLSIQQINDSGVLQTIYFDFDQADLTGISETLLRRNADWMKNNREHSVVIHGHCDNRGTIEYNLALGQRRANAVREYLSGQGVALSRLRTVTYGEERPERQGSSESAWAKNRRAEFVVG